MKPGTANKEKIFLILLSLFSFIILLPEGLAAENDARVDFTEDGEPYDIKGVLTIIEQPQPSSQGCHRAGLTNGAYLILDSNPERNSSKEWHYLGKMNGYCLSAKIKSFNRNKNLVCDDYNYVSPQAGLQLCALAEPASEQLQTNIELLKKLDTANKQISDANEQIEILKTCLIAPKLCKITNH